MPLVLVAQSTVEPVSLDEIKAHLRLSTASTAEDAWLGAVVTVARRYAENYTKRALVSSTWDLVIDRFPGGDTPIELPRPPLSTAVTITYVEDTTAGASSTVDATALTVDTDSEPGRVYPSYNNSWPSDVRMQRHAVRVRYASGYSTSSPCPESIKHWIKMRVGTMYENRESGVAANFQIEELPRDFVDGLLDPYVVMP